MTKRVIAVAAMAFTIARAHNQRPAYKTGQPGKL
jgi:hypothetical protein